MKTWGCMTATRSDTTGHGESAPGTIGPIILDAKRTGKPSAGNPHAGFDEAGAGNGTMERTEAPATKRKPSANSYSP